MFRTVTLRDGRTLEYADFGDPSGRPVLYFHGTPATAGQGAVVAEAAGTHGIRLVALIRPGCGASTATPPGLTSVAADAVELADLLGLGEVVAMGPQVGRRTPSPSPPSRPTGSRASRSSASRGAMRR